MSCCGQKRAAAASAAKSVRSQVSGRATESAQTASMAPRAGKADASRRALRYVGTQPLSLTGPASGRVYYFATPDATAQVDVADFEALLRTHLFVHHVG